MSTDVKARVLAVVKALHEELGKVPTVHAVRQKAECAMQEASDGVREYKDALLGKAGSAPVQLPEKVFQVATEAIGAIWQVANKMASEQFAIQKQELDETLAHAYQSMEETASELDQLQLKYVDLEKNSVQLTQTFLDLQSLNQKMDKELASAQLQLAESAGENKALLQLVEQLRTEQTLLHATIEQTRMSEAKLLERADQQASRADGLSDQLESLRVSNSALQQKFASSEAKGNELVSQIVSLQEQLATAQGAMEQARNNESKYRERAEQQASRIAELVGEKDALKQERALLQKKISDDELILKARSDQLALSAAEVHRLEGQLSDFGHVKSQSEERLAAIKELQEKVSLHESSATDMLKALANNKELYYLRQSEATDRGQQDALNDYGADQNPYNAQKEAQLYMDWHLGWLRGMNKKLLPAS